MIATLLVAELGRERLQAFADAAAEITQGLLVFGKAAGGGDRRQELALAEEGAKHGAAVLAEYRPEA